MVGEDSARLDKQKLRGEVQSRENSGSSRDRMEDDRINNHARSSFRELVRLERDQRGEKVCETMNKAKQSTRRDRIRCT